MLLSEAMIEKDSIKDSINRICIYLTNLLVAQDKSISNVNEKIINQKFEELDELFNKYQHYRVVLNRASSQTVIKVKDTELTLGDAIVVKEAMINKLEIFEDLLKRLFKYTKFSKYIICVDIEVLIKIVENIKSDVETLDIKIQQTLWNTEV